jgi:hypothetical protein
MIASAFAARLVRSTSSCPIASLGAPDANAAKVAALAVLKKSRRFPSRFISVASRFNSRTRIQKRTTRAPQRMS